MTRTRHIIAAVLLGLTPAAANAQPAPSDRAAVDTPATPRAAPASIGPACPAAIASPPPGDMAVVLSGGGARGLAHIGVLRVLDSLGVRPALVVGTSMGALVGALYAGGFTGRQIDSVARALPFETLFRRYVPITLLSAGDFAAPVSVLSPTFVLEVSRGRVRLQNPVAREPQINALFNQLLLRANLTAAGDFDRLPRRFRAVATDMRARSTVVLGGGDIAEAVRASIAIPVVFAPVERDGRLLVDGGLSANVPVDVARRSGASRVLISDVGVSMADSADGITTASMLAYLIDELFTQPPDSLGPNDLSIRPPVHAFGPLEFSDAVVGPLIDAGYRAAVHALQGCRPTARRTALPPPPIADAATIADRLARLADEGVYETVWLRPQRLAASAATSDAAGDGPPAPLRFAPIAVPAPERIVSVGLSYDGHEGARAWLAAANLALASGRARVGSTLSVGQWRQQLLFSAVGLRRRPLPRRSSDTTDQFAEYVRLPDPRADAPPWSTLTRHLLRPELSLTASHEIVRVYDDRGHERSRPSTRDLVLFAGVGAMPAAGQRVVLGPVAHIWSAHGAALPNDDAGRALGAMIRAARSFAPPSTGPDPGLVPTIAAEALWLDRYRRADAHVDLWIQRGQLILRPRAGAGWGDGLPLAAQFTLGGPQGFPGLRTGERRGDRFGFASLALLRRVAGPLYARAEVGGGRTSFAHDRRIGTVHEAGSGWVRGAELGLTADTPLGPFSIGYGIANTDRPVFKVRLGN